MNSPRPAMRILVNSKQLLDLLSQRGPQTVAELAVALDVPRPTVYRTLELLVDADLVSLQTDGRHALSLRLFDYDRAARQAYPIAGAARPHLTELGDSTGQSIFLSVPRPDGALCIDEIAGREVDLMVLAPGTTLPYNAGAGPRAMLPHLKDPEVTLRRNDLPSFTEKTLTTVKDILAEARDTRERGYSRSDEDLTIGVAALGVAVLDPHSDELVASVSIAGLRARIFGSEGTFVAALHEAADNITKSLFSYS